MTRCAARIALALAALTLRLPLHAQGIDLDAVEATDRFRSGVQLYHRGGWQAAILAFERSLSLKPDDTLVRTWLALANYRAGYVSAAIRGWRDLISAGAPEAASIQNRMQYATWRHGLGPELEGEPEWVVAYEISSHRGTTNVFPRPVSVRPLQDGSLGITSFTGNRIVVTDVNGTVLRTLRGGIYGLDRPFDLMETPDGVVVAELGGQRLVRLSPEGGRKAVFTGAPAGVSAPQFLAADGMGYLYVTDAATNRVRKYEPDGRWLLDFAATLSTPTGIAVRGDRLYVAERSAKRIAVFDLSGNRFPNLGEGQLQAPEGLAFWDDRTLLVADTTRLMAGDLEQDRFRVWGNLEARARRLTSVSQDAGGMLYLTDMDAEVVYVLTRWQNLVVGDNVSILRIDSDDFPSVTLAVQVVDRYGRPRTGLREPNFLLYEDGQAVPSFTLARAPAQQPDLRSVVVVDQSPAVAQLGDQIRSATLSLYDELGRQGGMSVVAGETPAVVAPAGTTRLKTAEAVSTPDASPRWRLDTALRLAANELAAGWGRKTIVYLTAGGLGSRPFENLTLSEVAAAMVNDNVVFVVVALTEGGVAPELDYLARTTGGRVVALSNPRGMTGLERELASVPWPIYLLRYTSATFPDFGRRYIPVRVEVVMPGPTGGDTLGYVGPPGR